MVQAVLRRDGRSLFASREPQLNFLKIGSCSACRFPDFQGTKCRIASCSCSLVFESSLAPVFERQAQPRDPQEWVSWVFQGILLAVATGCPAAKNVAYFVRSPRGAGQGPVRPIGWPAEPRGIRCRLPDRSAAAKVAGPMRTESETNRPIKEHYECRPASDRHGSKSVGLRDHPRWGTRFLDSIVATVRCLSMTLVARWATSPAIA